VYNHSAVLFSGKRKDKVEGRGGTEDPDVEGKSDGRYSTVQRGTRGSSLLLEGGEEPGKTVPKKNQRTAKGRTTVPMA